MPGSTLKDLKQRMVLLNLLERFSFDHLEIAMVMEPTLPQQ